jgi:hypothetical protein
MAIAYAARHPERIAALFGGAVGKDTVSRVRRKVKTDWEAWNARSLVEEPIVAAGLQNAARSRERSQG